MTDLINELIKRLFVEQPLALPGSANYLITEVISLYKAFMTYQLKLIILKILVLNRLLPMNLIFSLSCCLV